MKSQASHVSVPQQLHKQNQQYHHTHHVNKWWKQNQFPMMQSPEILNTDKLSKRVKPFLKFIGPCIVIYFYSKTNKMHQFLKFILFCSSTLHVSDGLSVHPQES